MSAGRQRKPLVAFGRRVEGAAGAASKNAGSPAAGRGVLSPQVGHRGFTIGQLLHTVLGRELLRCHEQAGLRCAACKSASQAALHAVI